MRRTAQQISMEKHNNKSNKLNNFDRHIGCVTAMRKRKKAKLTGNALLDVRVDGLIDGHGQIADARSRLLLGRVEAGRVLQVLFALVAVILLAELAVPRAHVALAGDAADELAHRLGRASTRVVANALVHLLQAVALLVDLGDSCWMDGRKKGKAISSNLSIDNHQHPSFYLLGKFCPEARPEATHKSSSRRWHEFCAWISPPGVTKGRKEGRKVSEIVGNSGTHRECVHISIGIITLHLEHIRAQPDMTLKPFANQLPSKLSFEHKQTSSELAHMCSLAQSRSRQCDK